MQLTYSPPAKSRAIKTDKPRKTMMLLMFGLALAMAYFMGMHEERGRQKLAQARLEAHMAQLR